MPILLLVVCMAAACGQGQETVAEDAPVAAPTQAPADTPAPTARPTNTPEPTATPTDMPEDAVQPAEPPQPSSGLALEEYDPAAVEHFERAMAYLNEAFDPASGDEARPDLGIEELNQAIAIQPDFAEAYLMRGMAQMMMAEEQALLLDPSLEATLDEARAHAQVDAMLALTETGRWDLAIDGLEQALTAEPGRVDLVLALGMAHMTADMTTALELKPVLAEAIENVFNQIIDALNEAG